ncbi:MarR family winged helix-turn-helix transcriptional regulator [Streptacidiphilus jiangxiensis]|uniref:DNA-binding transcriptional regulator, MarR family n=1 Tax=Streptacidiphilus jiangxiensis TaxID=235985 RepID=A0A1H7KIY4_STRJI|nr:MarR family transcriptional regulator [Streptacidiphilus jiangxiensis]SEK86853.1 DNA-binding transcriptional regulator, MarR family [Streptacidiphilus jiangxiensis]
MDAPATPADADDPSPPDIGRALRSAGLRLAQLNRRIGVALGLRDVDMDCFELITRLGPMTPGGLARAASLHPATVTGILDRLERAGWVGRTRDPADRRLVRIQALPERYTEVFTLFAGMNDAVERICSGYRDDDLRLIADFLQRVAEAGRVAVAALAERPAAPRPAERPTDRPTASA